MHLFEVDRWLKQFYSKPDGLGRKYFTVLTALKAWARRVVRSKHTCPRRKIKQLMPVLELPEIKP
jgi:hypothetical protein